MRCGRAWVLGVAGVLVPAVVAAAAIETAAIEAPWPHQAVRELEVGRYPVRWRQHIGPTATEGVFAGLAFTAPGPRELIWGRSADYSDVGTKVPGVTAVRLLEETDTRKLIEVDVKVLWASLTLRFEVEQEPPRVMRFRLTNRVIGEFRGVCTYAETTDAQGRPATAVALSTWLKTARPVPARLLIVAERMALLTGTREFLEEVDAAGRAPTPTP